MHGVGRFRITQPLSGCTLAGQMYFYNFHELGTLWVGEACFLPVGECPYLMNPPSQGWLWALIHSGPESSRARLSCPLTVTDSFQDWSNESRAPTSLQSTVEVISLSSSLYLSETCLSCSLRSVDVTFISCSLTRINYQHYPRELFILVSNQWATAAGRPSNTVYADCLSGFQSALAGPVGDHWEASRFLCVCAVCLWLMAGGLSWGNAQEFYFLREFGFQFGVHDVTVVCRWMMVAWSWAWGPWLGVFVTWMSILIFILRAE